MKLPITLIIILLLVNVFLPSRVGAQEEPDPTPEVVGGIEENDPAYGEDINETVFVVPGGELPSISVGINTDEFKFPDLTQLSNTAIKAIPFLLPQDLLDQYVPPENIQLKGKVFHPVCRTSKGTPNKEQASKGISSVTTPGWWPETLAATKLSQAVGVSEASSWVKFENAPEDVLPEGDSQNYALPDCPDAPGVSDSQVQPETSNGLTTIAFNAFEFIRNFFARLTGQGEEVTITAKPKQFVQGESEFANQTSREMGFLRTFCPDELFPSKVDGLVDTSYKGGEGQIDLAFQGLGGARKGYSDCLVASLYPAELQGLISIPQTPPLPNRPGTGAFELTGNPNSTQFTTLLNEAASAFNVPMAVLATVAWMEGGHMWGYSDSQISTYSAPGGRDPYNAKPNGCGARGPMQFLNDGIASDCQNLTGKKMDDVWAGFANAVNEATGERRTPNIDNIKDSLYAGAKKLWQGSRASSSNWNQEQVYNAGRGYLGECTTKWARLGNRTYCDFIWNNYR